LYDPFQDTKSNSVVECFDVRIVSVFKPIILTTPGILVDADLLHDLVHHQLLPSMLKGKIPFKHLSSDIKFTLKLE